MQSPRIKEGSPLNVRLDNLRVGTQAENMADMAQKGRAHTASRFKATEIATIVRQHKMGARQDDHVLGLCRQWHHYPQQLQNKS